MEGNHTSSNYTSFSDDASAFPDTTEVSTGIVNDIELQGILILLYYNKNCFHLISMLFMLNTCQIHQILEWIPCRTHFLGSVVLLWIFQRKKTCV